MEDVATDVLAVIFFSWARSTTIAETRKLQGLRSR